MDFYYFRNFLAIAGGLLTVVEDTWRWEGGKTIFNERSFKRTKRTTTVLTYNLYPLLYSATRNLTYFTYVALQPVSG